MTSLLQPFAEAVWVHDGPAVPFAGLPYTTRMTIVLLPGDLLWVHSPAQLSPALQHEVNALGQVKFLIAPNKLHHLFLRDWIEAYPQSSCFAAPGLARKRKDIDFFGELHAQPEQAWCREIDQLIFQGSPLMQEVVFFHRPSSTLILTDLIENFRPESFKPWQRMLARLTGILAPDGRTPLDWRLSFLVGRSQARACLLRMLEWHPMQIIIAHGECIRDDAETFLRRSFRWLQP